MTTVIVCTSSVRPFSVPKDAGVGVFVFTSIITKLRGPKSGVVEGADDGNVREWNAPDPRQEQNER